MPANDPLYVAPAYNPPDYLLSSTGLSRENLIRQYEGFCRSLQDNGSSPVLVFERLIGNLREAVSKALTDERAQHAAIEEGWHREKIIFQSKLDRTTDTAKETEKGSPQALAVHLASRLLVGAPISPAATSKQTYLQCWFTRSTNFNSSRSSNPVTSTRIRAATSTTPAPYSIAASWPDMDHLACSVNHGSYDTRMDPLITTVTIPTKLTHIVTFNERFKNPPQVIVWLTGLSATTGAAVCVKAVANDITETEFTLLISSGEDTRLGSVGVAWAVWPEGSPPSRDTIYVGSVSAATPGGERERVLSRSGSVGGTIRMAALSTVDLVLTAGLWVEVVIEGGDWSMRAGPADASVYSARVVYAFQ